MHIAAFFQCGYIQCQFTKLGTTDQADHQPRQRGILAELDFEQGNHAVLVISSQLKWLTRYLPLALVALVITVP